MPAADVISPSPLRARHLRIFHATISFLSHFYDIDFRRFTTPEQMMIHDMR